jgi:molybdate transport system ATP-binding protein
MTLPDHLNFIKKGQIWAITAINGNSHSELVNSITGKAVENVSLKHHFKNLSHTSDFYYQQRFNSIDSEDALTIKEHLEQCVVNKEGFWNLRKSIKLFNLEQLLDEQVIKLSNGETKRLLIATALINNPELITLDHPLTGLDAATRQQFGVLLKQISDSGITIVFATSAFEIPATATHVAVVEDGNIIFKNETGKFNPSDFNFIHFIPINTDLLRMLVSKQNGNRFNCVIAMKSVSVEYDGRKILHNINWIVRQGERWALTGPNGAGKSTLLSLVNADNPQAYANDIVLFDRKRGSGESIWDIKKQTGFVSPELYQYFPTDSSCIHIIESGFYDTVGLFRPADPGKEAISLGWMKLMQIENYANRLFSLVPGNVQRLCLLARALVKNPPLLILDEPTQGLDLSEQQFFVRLVDEICASSDITLIYVSHYEDHIPKAVTKRIRLDKGRMSLH